MQQECQRNNSNGDNDNGNFDSGNNNDDNNYVGNSGQHRRLMGMAIEWMRMVRVKKKYRKITYLLLNFTPLLHPTLPSLHPCSHASCLPQLVAVLPLVLHCLPLKGTSSCPPLIAPPPLVVPLFFSGALASCPSPLFVMSPLVMPPPPVCLCLQLPLHR